MLMVETKTSTIERQAVIFDFDGTLADSLEVFTNIAKYLSGGNAQIAASEVRSLRGLIRFGLRSGASKWRLPGLLTRVRSLVDEHIAEVNCFDGVPNLIKNLFQHGNEIYIVSTNSKPTIEKFLRLKGLDSYILGVFGSKKMIKSKTRSLRNLLSRQGLKPENCLYVGDEPRDIEACKEVGIKCVAVDWGLGGRKVLESLGPAGLAGSPDELLEQIKLLQLEV